MKTNTKKIVLNIPRLVLVMLFILLTTLTISLGVNISENYRNEQVQLQLLYRGKNEELKELTLKVSPDQKKQAYFQRKFSKDNVAEIDDHDYISVILDQGNNKEVNIYGELSTFIFGMVK